MHEATSTPAWAMLAYLIAGVFFILALRGLSSPSTSQRGNRFGIAGMGLAVGTTLLLNDVASLPEIVAAIAIGAVIGWVTAKRIVKVAAESSQSRSLSELQAFRPCGQGKFDLTFHRHSGASRNTDSQGDCMNAFGIACG